MDSYSQMPISYLKTQFQLWSHYLTTHQSANLFFLKNTGILPRLYQFRNYYKQTTKSKIQILDIKYSGATDPFTFERELKKLSNHTIIIAGDVFTRPDCDRLAAALQNHYLTSPWSLLIAHECAPSELIANQQIIASSLYIHPRPFTLPTDHSTIKQYIHNILKLWNVKLTPIQVDQVIDHCGNQPWLINEYVRLWVENPTFTPESIITHPSFNFRVKTLFDSLPKHYSAALSKISHNKEIFSEIKEFGLIDQDNNLIGLWIKNALSTHQQTRLITTPSLVIYDSIDITLQFSPGECRLINHFNHSVSTVTREEVAEIFYNSKSGDYSDWALSQIITRLRSKLSKHNIPLQITTKRGLGYGVARR